MKNLVEDLEKLLFEEIPEMETPKIRRCEWCHQALPNDRYHLKICLLSEGINFDLHEGTLTVAGWFSNPAQLTPPISFVNLKASKRVQNRLTDSTSGAASTCQMRLTAY